MKLKIILIAFTILTGCQNVNRPYKGNSGYLIYQTKENQFQVEVHGMDKIETSKMWEMKAAEICPTGKETIYTNVGHKNEEIKYVVNGMQQSTQKQYLVFYGEFKCNGTANKNIAIDNTAWQKSESQISKLKPVSSYLISTTLNATPREILILEHIQKNSPLETFTKKFGKPRRSIKENGTTYHEWPIGEDLWLLSHFYAEYEGSCLKQIIILPPAILSPTILLNLKITFDDGAANFNFYVRKIDNCIS